MYNLSLIKQNLKLKSDENDYLNKKYYLNLDNMTITKIKPDCNCKFEFECASFFCDYYRKVLNLDFNIYKEKNNIIFTSPIVNALDKNTKISKTNLLKNTQQILDAFILNHYFLKDILLIPELYIKAFVNDDTPDNFFIYNNEIYLLDLETFYFSIYGPNNTDIGLLGVKDKYKDCIKDYITVYEDNQNIKYINKLSY